MERGKGGDFPTGSSGGGGKKGYGVRSGFGYGSPPNNNENAHMPRVLGADEVFRFGNLYNLVRAREVRSEASGSSDSHYVRVGMAPDSPNYYSNELACNNFNEFYGIGRGDQELHAVANITRRPQGRGRYRRHRQTCRNIEGLARNRAAYGQIPNTVPIMYSENDKLSYYIHMTLNAFLTLNGTKLSELLTIRDSHIFLIRKARNYAPRINDICRNPLLGEVIINHIDCLQTMLKRNLPESFIKQYACTLATVNLLSDPTIRGQEWIVPVLREVTTDLMTITLRVLTSKCMGVTVPILEQAADALLYCFRLCTGDETEEKVKVLTLINQYLVYIFVAMKNIDIRRPFMCETTHMTYNSFLDQRPCYERFSYADDYYGYAFENCPEQYTYIKRSLLIRLAPLKIGRGIITMRNVLSEYGLLMFWELSIAVPAGNLIEFDRIMMEHEALFVEHGIYNFINSTLRQATLCNSRCSLCEAEQPQPNFLAVSYYESATVQFTPRPDAPGEVNYNFSYHSHGTVQQLYLPEQNPNANILPQHPPRMPDNN